MRSISTLLLLSAIPAFTQPFAIGTTEVEFFDVARNRDVPCVIHYPSATTGSNVAVSEGSFPVLIHGHGFVMSVDAYTNLRDGLVPRGYILVLPTTEGGFSPAHASFGADLAFLVGAMQAAGNDAGSIFQGHVAPTTALMGHSMGGGASFLGAAGNTSIQTVVNFAAAETNPSAIAAAASVVVPTLVFAASEDRVTPPETNQSPMYAAIAAPCKAYVSVDGGGHCYFGSNSFTCTLGESVLGADLSISREEQHDIVNDLAGLWLDHFLRDDQAAWNAFSDSLQFSTRITGERTCLTTALDPETSEELVVAPVPAVDVLRVSGMAGTVTIRIIDLHGKLVQQTTTMEGTVDVRGLQSGTYVLEATSGKRRSRVPFTVQR
jgi:dienelactone hydrolase